MASSWDVQGAVAALDALARSVNAATADASKQGAEAIRGRAAQNAPKVTGRLAGSILAGTPRSEGVGTWVTEIAPHVIYARIIELGGVITAHGNYMLRDRETGQVFGHQVTIPAHPYLSPALSQSTSQVLAIATKAWREAMGG